MGCRILVVEDDDVTACGIVSGLESVGMIVDRASDGAEGLALATNFNYDVIVLDRMLPETDGMLVISNLRAEQIDTPVLMLSALAAIDERVEGLVAGADDYLGKPFAISELQARVQVLSRRGKGAKGEERLLAFDDLEMDMLQRIVSRGGRPLELKPLEFRLLAYFMRHAGQTVTREMILEEVWNYHFDPGTNVIDVHVSRLRRKIEEGYQQRLLHTVRGMGYRLGASC